jgi:multimeric flavodoxin WrbA
MKAVILLGTLKKTGLSNTEVLSEFVAGKLRAQSIETEIIKLVEHTILPGTYSDMGNGDAWPEILEKILHAPIVLFATPVWWGNQSSEMQKVIERLDELHDEIMEGKKSRLDGKIGGILITGSGDGAEHITGNLANFLNSVGFLLPPYTALSVLWEGQRKGATPSREALMEKYRTDYDKAADTMIEQLLKYAAR